MNHSQVIAENSDSLIDLLAAQCADLEKLLALAREETTAAELGNFGTILNITSERAEIGRRLETCVRQIAELRGFLGKNTEVISNEEVTRRAIELANLTLAQDQKTRLLLTVSREQTREELVRLEAGNRGANIYLREQKKGLAYSENF